MTDLFAAPDAYASEHMTTAPAESALQGRVHYELKNQAGETAKLGEHDIFEQLHHAGYSPVGLSPDARLISFQDEKGTYDQPIEKVFQKLGWEVTGKDFVDSDRSGVRPELTFAVNTPSMANDATKREFLTHYLKHHGIDHPQVDGMGDDWHAFDPTSGKWMALTKGKGAGLDDLAKYGAKAPSFLGAVLGTGLGAGAGPVGMAAGSAGGGFLGGRTADSLGSLVDPEAYADALGKQGFQQTATDWAKDAGMDALGGLGAAGFAKVLPGLAKAGIASSAMRGVGGAVEAGGEGVSHLAGAASKGFPRELGMAMADPTGATMLGDTMQLPAQAIKGAASLYDSAAPSIGRGIQRMGSHPMAEELAPGIAGKMRDMGRSMRMRTPTSFEGMNAEEALRHTPFGGVGRVADSVEKVGSAIVAPVRGAYTAVTRGIQGAGKAAQGVGGAMAHAGEAVGPYEMNALNHMGSEELRSRLLKRQRDLQMQGVNRKLVPDTLAYEDQPPY